MEQTPEPISAGRTMLKSSRRKRILIGISILAGFILAIAVDRWILSAGRGIYLLTIPVAVYVLLLVLWPEWVARMEKKREERLKNWQTHPGQWS